MYCRNCGKEVNENAVVCIHCGCSIEQKKLQTKNVESKKTLGVVLGLFLGLIGLIIGVCCYQSDSYERETFMKGWVKGFVISIIIAVVIGVFYGILLSSLLY